jgi:hypothetical protein
MPPIGYITQVASGRRGPLLRFEAYVVIMEVFKGGKYHISSKLKQFASTVATTTI